MLTKIANGAFARPSPRRPARLVAAPVRVRKLTIKGPLFMGYLVIVFFVCGGLGWAAVAPVTKGATIAGALITESKTKTVQHGKGGNIRVIHVREGQKVEQDQLLITLDDSDIRETMRGIVGQISSVAGVERLGQRRE